MKTKMTLLIMFLTTMTFAQKGINYKAIITDGSGNLIANTQIEVQFNILKSAAQTNVYSEIHEPTTDDKGIIVINIGEGTLNTGSPDFTSIEWGIDTHFLNVLIDKGDGLVDMGTTEFKAVPYALNVAKKQHVLSVPAAVFYPNNEVCSFFNSIGPGGAEITNTNGATSVCVLQAPVQLPHGAHIDAFTVYYIDNSEAQLAIQLIKESFEPGFALVSDIIETTGNSTDIIEETTALNHVVDNNNGGYFVRVYCRNWDAFGAKKIKGVKIVYTY
ncbi:hypothetical protein [Algibacter pectinivorans]|nr:hypothetical protein [Algibacter pectinivorans]